MKKLNIIKTNKTAILRVTIFLIITLCILTACNTQENTLSAFTTCYDISISYENGLISASQDTLFQAPNDIDNILFRIYPNAFDNEGYNNIINILSCKIDMLSVDYVIYGKDNSFLSIPCKLSKGDVCTISFEYTINVSDSNDRFGITQSGIANLNHFYPILSYYQNGWREDEIGSVGDPFLHESANYYVNINCDGNMSVACSGIVQNTKHDDNKKRLQIEAENIRDFALIIGDFNKESATLALDKKEVLITYYYYNDSDVSSTISRIKDSIMAFSKAFGEYAYPTFTLAQSEINSGGGMEYGAFAMVNAPSNYNEYLDVITHEIAHQWWYSAVGNDQIFNAWLDEGLSEFCTYYYHYLMGDRSVYNENIGYIITSFNDFNTLATTVGYDGNMNKPLSQYITNGEYVATVYYKGAMLFDLLKNLIGDEKLNTALSSYYTSNKYKIVTPTALIDSFKTVGYDIGPIIESFVNNNI